MQNVQRSVDFVSVPSLRLFIELVSLGVRLCRRLSVEGINNANHRVTFPLQQEAVAKEKSSPVCKR